jgi:hypothetical protein
VIGTVPAIGLAFLLESLDYGGPPGGRVRTGIYPGASLSV